VIRILPPRTREDRATKLIGTLGALGYEVHGSYVPIHLLSNVGQCVWDHLPRAEKVWADLVELPCEPSVAMADIERIADIVKASVRD
jgi:dTDP-4-amino-4,6-dideoxygalactose transaminase